MSCRCLHCDVNWWPSQASCCCPQCGATTIRSPARPDRDAVGRQRAVQVIAEAAAAFQTWRARTRA